MKNSLIFYILLIYSKVGGFKFATMKNLENVEYCIIMSLQIVNYKQVAHYRQPQLGWGRGLSGFKVKLQNIGF